MAVDIAHPWPEWVALMELLLHKGHLDASAFTGAAPSKDSNLVRAPEDRLVRWLSLEGSCLCVYVCSCTGTACLEAVIGVCRHCLAALQMFAEMC